MTRILFSALFIIAFCICTPTSAQDYLLTLNGFRYRIIKDNLGEDLKEGDYVYFKYIAHVNDSLVFNSISNQPHVKFKLPKPEKKGLNYSQPIIDVFYNLSKGDSAEVIQVVNDEIRKSIDIPDAKEINFFVVILDVKNEAEYEEDIKNERALIEKNKIEGSIKVAQAKKQMDKTLALYKKKSKRLKLKTTSSGLQYVVHELGKGPVPYKAQIVSVAYYGALLDGTMFDNSYERGQDLQFPLGQGQVIKGWDEAFGLLPVGSKATLIIPAELGYGESESGPIPANSVLAFYVEVVGVN